MINKKYGHFDDQHREYVITDPQTPWPWINYLGNEDFFSLISNTAGGYSFYKDAKFRRITRYRYNGVPMDNGGRYLYVKDNDTVWNPGWKPCKTQLDSYECRHGMNYTRITGSKNGVQASVLFFVPLKTWAEVQKLTLTNTQMKSSISSYSRLLNGVCGMLLLTWKTSSVTSPPVKWKSTVPLSIIRQNIKSVATTMPIIVSMFPFRVLTPTVSLSSDFTTSSAILIV